jgi:hypothetical protein
METKEFYIRKADETDAQGPYTLEQLTSLAETGHVTAATLYYDAMGEKWIAIGDNAELKGLVFPEKKKLTLRKPEEKPRPAGAEAAAPGTDVAEFLKAAEGQTEETKSLVAASEMADRCAKIGTWGCILMLVFAAAGEVMPSLDVLTHFSVTKLIANPLVILGLLDILLALVLALGVVSVYPFIRFRAMLGLGFLGFVFYGQGQTLPLLAAIAGSLGLYLSTVFLRYAPLAFSLVLGLGGMGVLSFYLIR